MAGAIIKKFFDNVQKKFNIQKIFKCLCTGNITKSNFSCNIHKGKKLIRLKLVLENQKRKWKI